MLHPVFCTIGHGLVRVFWHPVFSRQHPLGHLIAIEVHQRAPINAWRADNQQKRFVIDDAPGCSVHFRPSEALCSAISVRGAKAHWPTKLHFHPPCYPSDPFLSVLGIEFFVVLYYYLEKFEVLNFTCVLIC